MLGHTLQLGLKSGGLGHHRRAFGAAVCRQHKGSSRAQGRHMHARNTHQLAFLSVELPSQQHTIHVVRKTVPAEHPLGVVWANNMPDSPTAAEQDSLLRTSSDTDTEKQVHDAGSVDWLATGLCFIFPAIGGMLFGYDIGASSGVLVSLSSESLSGTDWWSLTSFQSGLVVSMSLLGALTGSLLALVSGNRIGRRTELMLASVLYGVGATLLGVSPNLGVLLAARVLYGLGIGFAMHAAPAYIAETSPPSVRGMLISLKEAIIVGGILAGYASGFWLIDTVGGWRSMYGVAAPLALLLGVGMASLPESPRWLLLNGAGRNEAVRALVRAEGRRASNLALVEAEIDEMAANLRSNADGSAAAAAAADGGGGGGSRGGGSSSSSVMAALGLTLFQEKRYLRPLLVGMSLMLFQQITGQPSVLYYASQIFERAGFASGQEAAGVSVLLGAFKLVMTLIAVATVDKLGRRPLLLGGVGGMVIALLLLTAAQGGVELAAAGAAAGGGGLSAAWVSAVALLLYVGCYQISFGPISWLIVGEVFPLAVRSQALALATFVNFASNFGVSLVLPTVQEVFGMQLTYATFAAIGVAAVANIYYNVPETKNKTLEQIEAIWRK